MGRLGITNDKRRTADGLATGRVWGLLSVIAVVLALAAAPAGASSTNYLSMAQQGVKQAGAWANAKYHWYNAVLHDHTRYPQATTVDAVPLFEAIDYVALAAPTSAHKAAVTHFADHAELYWDKSITPAPGTFRRTPAWSPQPSQRGDVQAYFDANGWWSLAFMDAYGATHDGHYLHFAEEDYKFIAQSGWDSAGGGGFWRDTHHSTRDGDSLAAAIDLAARLYQATKQHSYLADADKWILWADANLLKSNGTYTAQISHSDIMPHDGEGAMLGAFTSLCESGAAAPSSIGSWCSRAESFATVTVQQFFPLSAGPSIDAVYLRDLLALYAHDHNAQWYSQANGEAGQILHHARASNGLFLKAWDGSSSIPGVAPNSLRTHAASVSVFAALAAVPAPGPA
jgi:hypothetical protein